MKDMNTAIICVARARMLSYRPATTHKTSILLSYIWPALNSLCAQVWPKHAQIWMSICPCCIPDGFRG